MENEDQLIFITGANGQVGYELCKALDSRGASYRAFSKNDWDISSLEDGEKHLSSQPPKVLINCAAYTAVDKAESEVESAEKINSVAPGILKKLCIEKDIFLVHISTDFVFGPQSERIESRPGAPWRTSDKPVPEGVYARTKLEGEVNTQKENQVLGRPAFEGTLILRTSWVYSSHGKNFPKTILSLASDEARSELRIVEDQIGRPTSAKSIAEFIVNVIYSKGLLECNSPSRIDGELLHFGNTGIASWYDLAVSTLEFGKELGIYNREIPVRPIETASYPTPAPRPNYSVLELSKADGYQTDILYWRDALKVCLREIAASETGQGNKR